jgi:hypothetical protein
LVILLTVLRIGMNGVSQKAFYLLGQIVHQASKSNNRRKRYLPSPLDDIDIMKYPLTNPCLQSGGELMRRLFAIGAVLVTVGAFILILSAWYHGVIVGEYADENPLDTSGPCEGMSQDVGTCNLLKLTDSLWIPGWIVIYLGSLILVVGTTLWSIKLRVPTQPQFQPISQKGEDLCPYCVLSWLPEDQREHCKLLKKPIGDAV